MYIVGSHQINVNHHLQMHHNQSTINKSKVKLKFEKKHLGRPALLSVLVSLSQFTKGKVGCSNNSKGQAHPDPCKMLHIEAS